MNAPPGASDVGPNEDPKTNTHASMSLPSGSGVTSGDVVWRPSSSDTAGSRVEAFRRASGAASMDELRSRAVRDPDWFWRAVCEDLAIDFAVPPETFYRRTSDETLPEWCVGGQMNIVTSCLDKWERLGKGHATALRYESESGHHEVLSYSDLAQRVRALTAFLRGLGVVPGTVVAIMMPMNPSAVVALLAVARCGAIALPLFSGFGRSAVAIRLQESEATVALCADTVQRRGRPTSVSAALIEALPECPSLRHLVLDRIDPGSSKPGPAAADRLPPGVTCHDWRDALTTEGRGYAGQAAVGSCEQPLLLMFTSGTTGRPKGALHSHCGFPIKAAQDMRHAMDLGPSDTLHWVSDLGWMMGPWAIFGALIGGMTLALYDGAPDYPDVMRLPQFVKDAGVTLLGLSPPLARLMRAAGRPNEEYAALTKGLRAVGSTGSPWDLESWLWTFQTLLGGTRPILNYSGGTEVSGGILCGDWLTPLKPCSFAGPVLGMDVDTVSPEGKHVRGEPGELVIRNHWIGMTRGFWRQDPRYRSTYWSRFPGLWTHGDLAIIDGDGLWTIVGRSDDTIKVAGKRLGPAEVETIVNASKGVRESAAIGVHDELKGEALVVFCVPSGQLTEGLEDLRAHIKQALARELGKPLTPREVWFVRSLPRTRNAKTMHRLVRALYEGQAPGDLSALDNADALDDIRARF